MKPLAETEQAGRHSRSYVYLISLIAAAGGFNWGFDIILMSGAILYLKKHFNIAELTTDLFSLHISSAWIEGFTMTSAMYGTVVGMLLGGSLADRIGRKRTLVVAAILLIISAVMTTIPKTLLIWNHYCPVKVIFSWFNSLNSSE
jgi:MFS family permease